MPQPESLPLPPDSKYHDYSPRDWAMEYISSYGQIDGAHHKAWVLDQVARVLMYTPVKSSVRRWPDGHEEITFTTDTPSLQYDIWRAQMRGEWCPINEEWEYEYDEGIAP